MPDASRENAADLALLLDAAKGAGEIAARHFAAGVTSWEKSGGQGPVTEADLEVNAHLEARLREARPSYGWLSEESAPLTDLSRLEHRRVFVIDPIDGTRAFADGQKSFAHSLAVVEDGKPVAAVIYLPLLGLCYRAERGQGAFLNDAPIRASARKELAEAQILGTASMLYRAQTWRPEVWQGRKPDIRAHFRPSLAWRLALVAEGKFDATLALRDSWDWDIAAGALIIEEAGGRVADRNGAALTFNSLNARSQGVVGAGTALYDALHKALSPAPAT